MRIPDLQKCIITTGDIKRGDGGMREAGEQRRRGEKLWTVD
jgi:hypothetical protein